MKIRNKHEFWVTNVNYKKDVCLGDLRVTIRAGKSVNLLDDRHYSYTLEQIQKSAESGSIKAKSKFIKVRDLPPIQIIKPGKYEAKKCILTSQIRLGQKIRNSSVEVEYKQYEELGDDVEVKESDEKFAEAEADMALDDIAPLIAADDPVDEK